jgi:trk system potassium uptake protein TrkA
MAKQLGAKKAIARVDSNEYLEPNSKEIFIDMGIDYLFYPEQIAAREVINLLGHTSSTEYIDFAAGKLSMVAFRLELTSPLLGRPVIGEDCDNEDLEYRVVAIVRGSKTIIPSIDDRFEEEDMVYVIARHSAASRVAELSGRHQVDVRNMMILGGSRIGVRIANELQNSVDIKLVDYNADKAFRLAEMLDKTLIINEDGRDTEAMMEEDISGMDAFVAVTGRSETNILAAMLAKRMGVKKVIAEVENINYISLAESVGVDTIINKKLITASNIFRFTMSSDVQAIKCLTGSRAEVLEFIVKPNSPATKEPIRDLGLPEDSIVGGVVRGDRVFIAVGDTQINAYDRVVVFAMPEVVMRVAEFFN